METSKAPRGVFKGHYADSRTQRNQLRFSSIEQAMGYEDSWESGIRYVDRKPPTRPEHRERTQPRGMGRKAWLTED